MTSQEVGMSDSDGTIYLDCDSTATTAHNKHRFWSVSCRRWFVVPLVAH